ncbi:hypothetical protein F4861DRAFT_437702 [Xylaria intraflava]|nr:hypothetical protein F4861DRAFT_437702 [Xylaria intraflava]
MTIDKNDEKLRGKPVPVYLIPWDPDSQDHRDRMKLQRIACGWNFDQIDNWKDAQRAGELGLHWVVLHPDHPETPSRLERHFAAFPGEVEALLDTAQAVLGRPHKPDPLIPFFHPVGHVTLSTIAVKQELETSPSKGILSITGFYISTVLQGNGLGAAALRHTEKMAKDELGAKTITLETIANESCRADSPRMIALKRPAQAFTKEDWYLRLGYSIYNYKEASWFDVDDTGKEWPTKSVFLRKDLV